MDGVWYTVETCFSDKPHTHLSFLISVHGRESCLGNFIKKNKLLTAKMNLCWLMFQYV